MNKLEAINAFCLVAKNSNFSLSARQLGVSPTMVSKHIQSLESHLSCRLFNRNTRKVQLTEAGKIFYKKVSPLLSQLQDLDREMASFAQTPKGPFRISASIEFGSQFLAPVICRFCEQYPEVELQLDLSNDRVSLLEEDVELAIRVAPHLPDSNLIAVPVASTDLKTWASPEYLARMGVPANPADLKSHRCLFFSQTPRANTWLFNIGHKLTELPFKWYWSSDNGRVLNEAAACGEGVVQAPEYSVYQYRDRGKLVEILPQYCLREMPISAIYSHRRDLSVNIRQFIQLLRQYFSDNCPWKANS